MKLTMLNAQCCIAGGGPAGLMAGALLARAGVNVVVLEKHQDFLRDFRGDTIHPSTMEVMHELGWLDAFLKLPHYPARHLMSRWGAQEIEVGNFTELPTQARFIALMPQWDFLNFVAQKGREFPNFNLLTRCEAKSLVEEAGRIVGVRAQCVDGPVEVRADLVIAADGRGSVLRDQSGLALDDIGAPMDVLWLRIARRPDDSAAIEARFGARNVLVMINRGDYWQCAYVIGKGRFEQVRAQGLAAFQATLAQLTGFEASRLEDIRDWEQVKLLNVQVNRLRQWWRKGLLCIGDAAHAMSPIGGVGVNLAVQDAVAASNILARPLREGSLTSAHLEAVQTRREFPARMTQRAQVYVQQQVIQAALEGDGIVSAPVPLRIANRIAPLRRLLGRLIGMGVRPEHVQTEAFQGVLTGTDGRDGAPVAPI